MLCLFLLLTAACGSCVGCSWLCSDTYLVAAVVIRAVVVRAVTVVVARGSGTAMVGAARVALGASAVGVERDLKCTSRQHRQLLIQLLASTSSVYPGCIPG